MEGTVELGRPEPDPDSEPEPEPDVGRPVDDVPTESAEPEGRRYPSTLGGACYLMVLLASAVGLVIVAHGDWRPGVRLMSAALGFGAVVRLLMPARQAGMLAVRRRLFDVVILVALAVALWFLSTNIPNQPPL